VSAQPVEEDLVPALFQHCCDVYALMERQATKVGTRIIYEGFLTKLITEKPIFLSVPYYTSVRSSLVRMGCITQLRRGGGSSPSLWVLNHPPTLQLFTHERPLKKAGTQRIDSLEQQIRDCHTRIAALESTVRVLSMICEWEPGQ
jgi:hypothetical protein